MSELDDCERPRFLSGQSKQRDAEKTSDGQSDRAIVLPVERKTSSERRQSGLVYAWRDGVPLEFSVTPERQMQMIAKRFVDILLASVGILFLLPLLGTVALAVKWTSPGPVIFRQKRVGLSGVEFDILKFRTMYAESCDPTGRSQTRIEDERVTPLGRFLRSKSIDELPQLFNVLLGDMSLVGPRPHVAGMLAGGEPYETLVPYYALRHAMKPGITGWAQANGLRGSTEDASLAIARVDHDIAYIQNFSLRLDAIAIVMTLRRELSGGTGV